MQTLLSYNILRVGSFLAAICILIINCTSLLGYKHRRTSRDSPMSRAKRLFFGQKLLFSGTSQ